MALLQSVTITKSAWCCRRVVYFKYGTIAAACVGVNSARNDSSSVILPAKTKCSLLFYKRRNFLTAHFLAIKMTDSCNMTDWEALELENTPAKMIIDYGQLHPDWTTFLDRCRVSQHIFSINRLRVSHNVSCHHRIFRLSYRC